MAQQTDLERVKPYTKSDFVRLGSMASALYSVDLAGISGDIVECGVWRGGNIMLARLVSPSRICWMYDTFNGMTEPGEFDTKRDGERAIDRYYAKKNGGTKWDAVSLEKVRQDFINEGIDPDNKINFIVGDVEQTLQKIVPTNSIAILRLDVDWYIPTKVSLEILYPRLAFGGFLIVDDYGHWLGCKKAVDDFFQDNSPPYEDADYSCRVFRKC